MNHVKRGGCNKFNHCRVFYRNKPHLYYMQCVLNDKNIMKVYMKDNNGDPKSIINSRIKGLFFATSVSLTGEPPNTSHFGPCRICIPATAMLAEDSNLYFADFYCNYRAHYVTVVLTKPGSETDQFCKRKLFKLDIRDNDFLWRNDKVYVTDNVWVEVLYTEDVDLSRPDCKFSDVPSTGTSTPGGLPKNPRCLVCNLPSTTPRRGGGDDGFDALAALIRKLGL